MPAVIEIARNDFGKDLNFTVTDADGTAISLSGLTVTFKAGKPNASALQASGTCVFTGLDPTAGQCKYVIKTGDFDEVGEYHVELEIKDAPTGYTYCWTAWEDTNGDQLIIRVKKDLPREVTA